MPLTSPEAIHNRAWADVDWPSPFYGVATAAHGSLFNGAGAASLIHRCAYIEDIPASLESGVSAYIPANIEGFCTAAAPVMYAELVPMGTLNLSTNVFTDQNAMPSRSYLGTSGVLPSYLLVEVTSALNATPGSVTWTYQDQDGNGGASTGALALTASSNVQSCGLAPLAAGDTGIRDITNAVRSGGTTPSGTLQFYGVIPIHIWPGSVNQFSMSVNLIAEGNIRRLAASAKTGFFAFGTTSAAAAFGWVHYVGDTT